MASNRIDIRPLTPRIGAEISGVNLGEPLDKSTFDIIHQALMDHLVIFFRDQHITPEQQIAFGRHFGDLHIHPAAPSLPGLPEAMIIHADANSSYANGEDWHSDVSCDEVPPMGSILRIHTLPPFGGDTLFANMYTAFETLSPPIRAMLDGMTALHDGELLYRGRYTNSDSGRVYPKAVHPVIRTHPVTGKKALYVNSFFTSRILELSKAESAAVLQMLFRHIETPEFSCRFRWQQNSVAFWDNRAAQHQAIWDYFPATRSGVRVTVAGDRPF